ncbi:MAG: hypothetical protein OEY19_01570 [Gammaproteobacteria bacterium]|nr:hypothetical protein [Gammaproteobacteria bacterium]MDH5629173.1 hypothetical protein [Gammaproteobacteria bacterium]
MRLKWIVKVTLLPLIFLITKVGASEEGFWIGTYEAKISHIWLNHYLQNSSSQTSGSQIDGINLNDLNGGDSEIVMKVTINPCKQKDNNNKKPCGFRTISGQLQFNTQSSFAKSCKNNQIKVVPIQRNIRFHDTSTSFNSSIDSLFSTFEFDEAGGELQFSPKLPGAIAAEETLIYQDPCTFEQINNKRTILINPFGNSARQSFNLKNIKNRRLVWEGSIPTSNLHNISSGNIKFNLNWYQQK